MELTKQQNKVFEQLQAFTKSDASVFILRGYAGTKENIAIVTHVDQNLRKATLVYGHEKRTSQRLRFRIC